MAGLALTALLWADGAHAQTAARLPVPPQGSPLPGVAAPEGPRLAPGLSRPPPPSAPVETSTGATHLIATLVVDDVTAFSPAAVSALTGHLTGSAVPEGQIEASRRALVDLYRSHGYVYTTVRAIIHGTELRFQVVEGYVAAVKLDGDIGPAGLQVLRFLNHLVGEIPLRTSELERWLLLAQDIPGLTVRSVLNPSLGDPGALTLVAQVSRRVTSGYVSADNRAFNLSGPEEGLGVFNIDSLTEFGERTQLSLFGAFDGTNLFGQLSEEMYLGGSGLKLKLYAGIGHSSPSGSLALIGYNGVTRVFGGQISYPLIRARTQSLNLTANFDATESDIHDDLGPDGASVRGSFDSLRMLRFGADYALLDTVLGPDRSGLNEFTAKLTQGLALFGASRNGDTTTPPARVGEKIDFTKFTGEISRTQTLFHPYADATIAFVGAIGGQYATELLPPSEKFYLGGPTFNRGYYYGQVSGDKALTISAELQLNTPLPMSSKLPFDMKSQFYLFYDWGAAWQNTSLESDVTVRSAGMGVRLFIAHSTEVDLEGVYRISLFPNGQGPDVSPLNAEAFYWQVLQRF
ncbi:MAG TPA: ShlB/FhaC/HecB family hemolysin secretion/activation protein [Rhodopila sp.]